MLVCFLLAVLFCQLSTCFEPLDAFGMIELTAACCTATGACTARAFVCVRAATGADTGAAAGMRFTALLTVCANWFVALMLLPVFVVPDVLVTGTTFATAGVLPAFAAPVCATLGLAFGATVLLLGNLGAIVGA